MDILLLAVSMIFATWGTSGLAMMFYIVTDVLTGYDGESAINSGVVFAFSTVALLLLKAMGVF